MPNNDTPLSPITIYLKSNNYTIKYEESNLSFDLNRIVAVQPNMEILMKIDSFQFTNSFYTIDINNRFFYYTISGIKYTLTIPIGFYTIDDLIVILNSLTTLFVFSWDYYKYTTTITSTSSFNITSGINNIYNILGFDSFGTIGYATSFTSPYLFNTMNVQQLKVCIPNINLQSIEKKTDRRDNILYGVRVSVGAGEIQNFYNTNDFMYKLSENTISFLNIQILDQNDRFVLFNGIEWYLSINISFQYKKDLIPAHYLTTNYEVNNAYEYTAEEALEDEHKKKLDIVLDEIIYRNKLLNKNKISKYNNIQ
jgi:hypothetical protein